MLISKRNILSVILACLAIAAIASPAGAVVQAGVVGGGIHMQYGPQDAGGNYMGIASESYDFYIDAMCDYFPPTGWGDRFPTWSGAQRPPDGIGYGYVLLAFNPYTGEVWNDIPAVHQLLDLAADNIGHTPTVEISGVDGGGNPVKSDVVVADLGRGYAEDCVYITGAFIPAPVGIYLEPFGSFVHTSSDGGILSTTGWPVYAGGPALMETGDEVRTYAAGDPDRPDCFDPGDTGDQTFAQTKTWGHTDFWNPGGWWAGNNGGAPDNLYGFEMDGIKGWMRLDFAAHRTGVRLTEYYFDDAVPGDFNGDRAVDAADIDVLCDNMGSLDPVYDLDDGSGTGSPDGDVDEDDMIYLIEHLVELQDGSGRVGTKRGDFNLDGFVNGTDLALMKVAFGQPGQDYADGNANCDLFVDGTDLAILKVNFGFIAPTGGSAGLATGGGVPEPASLALLAMGCMAVLRRNRN